jgi:hypothetical protein
MTSIRAKTGEELVQEVKDRKPGWDARVNGFIWSKVLDLNPNQALAIAYLQHTGSLTHLRTPIGAVTRGQASAVIADLAIQSVIEDDRFGDYLLEQQSERFGKLPEPADFKLGVSSDGVVCVEVTFDSGLKRTFSPVIDDEGID